MWYQHVKVTMTHLIIIEERVITGDGVIKAQEGRVNFGDEHDISSLPESINSFIEKVHKLLRITSLNAIEIIKKIIWKH